MAVILGALVPCDVVTDDAVLNLSRAYGVHSLAIAGNSFLYAAGFGDNDISGFEVGADGGLTAVAPPLGSPEIFGAVTLTSAVVGGTTYLFVAGLLADQVSSFRVAPDGGLVHLGDVADAPDLALMAPADVGTVWAGGVPYLVVAGMLEDGFSVFRIGSDGSLAYTASILDDEVLELMSVWDLASVTISERSFLFAAGMNDNGISGFEFLADGSVIACDSVNDADDPAFQFGGVMGLATATIGEQAFLIAAGFADDGLSVFSIGAEGELANISNLGDSEARGLDGVSALTVLELEGETFVAASSQNDGAVGLFHLGADGVLSDAVTIFDDEGLALAACLGGSFIFQGGQPIFVAGSDLDNGLSSFEIGGGHDTLTRGRGSDLLLGLYGNDRLDGGRGADRLVGGRGADVYVVDDPGDGIVEQDGAGTDRVLTWVDWLTLAGTAGLVGIGNELDNKHVGNAGANLLRGAAGHDTLLGQLGATC